MTVDEGTSAAKVQTAPHPDDQRKPESPPDLKGSAWKVGLKRAAAEFGRDKCTDLAASLTYYAVLAMFPALLALVSLVSLFSEGEESTDALIDMLAEFVPASTVDTLEPIIAQMTEATGAGLTLAIGIAGAVWSASGYVGGFGRAMNRIYEVDEGRNAVKLKLQQVLITLVLVVLAAAVLLGLVVSGPVAEWVGGLVGLGDQSVMIWNIAKWPVILLIVVFIVALLYYATPNVKQPKFRWMSIGAFIAILVWIVASLGFGFYVGNFGNYNKTYGSLAGVIIFLLWLWLTNIALLFGAEVDAEVERVRQLQGGIRAERDLQLPPRDTSASDKAAKKLDQQVAEGRELRQGVEKAKRKADLRAGIRPGSGDGRGDGSGKE